MTAQPAHAIERRLYLPLAAALVLSNLQGVLVLTVFLGYLLPLPALRSGQHALDTNLVAIAIALALMLPVGLLWTIRLWRPVHDWLASGRPAAAADRRAVLRTPARLVRVPGTFWTLAALLFAIVNATYSGRLAVAVVIAIILGGLATGVITYLTTQRLLRPVTLLALRDYDGAGSELPGLSWRVMLAWALGTGVPVLGSALVGIGVLAGVLPGSVRHLAGASVFLSVTGLASGAFVMWISTRSFSEPLADLREAMTRVRVGEHDVRVAIYDGSEIGQLQAGFNDMVAGLEEREQLRDLFGRQVGAEVAEQSLERGTELGGEELDVAVMFCDLIGSTRLAGSLPPQELVRVLNRFFGIIVDAVGAEGGTVNKFVGDAGLAVFGAPLPHHDAAGAALRAALAIRARLPSEIPGYDAGIGVSAGRVVAGNVGSAERFEYTVIGDAVNETSRLTELAKHDRGRILVSAHVVGAAIGPHGRWQRVGRQRLRGRAQPTVILRPAPDQEPRAPATSVRPQASRS